MAVHPARDREGGGEPGEEGEVRAAGEEPAEERHGRASPAARGESAATASGARHQALRRVQKTFAA